MPRIPLEQAILVRNQDCYEVSAQSEGAQLADLTLAETTCGEFLVGTHDGAGAELLFVQPLGRRSIAIFRGNCQAGDRQRFHVLLMRRDDYRRLGGDPFWIADQFPPEWTAMGSLPALSLSRSAPCRSVEDVCSVLRNEAEGPNLLGGCQILVDGGRIYFERTAPDAQILRDLWALLPTSTRAGLWPATYVSANRLRLHAVVVPPACKDHFKEFYPGSQAGDYPEGRYELQLQVAAEAGTQADLDGLFARRSRAETWRFGLILLACAILLVLFANWFLPTPAPRPAEKTPPANSVKEKP